MRSKATFDHVIDFDRVVCDAASPNLLDPAYNCDGIHPTPRGYYEMGNSVSLDWFR